ncbi:MAG: phosphoribosylamine--glycine ligase [Deltaproteobacteria bacterium]|nr:phosphoribosylamine--glycine ligase [Deltaproteobacteria bacterium]
MNVLLVGSGGREHALAWKIAQSEQLQKLFVAPGSDSIATLPHTNCIDIGATDCQALVNFAKDNNIDLVIIGPEQPLAEGLADLCIKHNINVFGPTQQAAQLEASKIFAKNIMLEAGIPTANSQSFTNLSSINDYLKQASYPLVIKADGLAAGKGVAVCQTQIAAMDFASSIFEEQKFGTAGAKALVEECLIGRECSILGITDGKTIRLLESAQDHKRLKDNDQGPNTGGMGAYSPSPIFTPSLKEKVLAHVFQPLLTTLQKKNIPYCGIIYAGIMVTHDAFYVLEFNARFGDPETQVILPRLDSDILDLFMHAVDGTLAHADIRWKNEAALTIVMASKGYPESSEKGIPIEGLETKLTNAIVFHAGTKKVEEQWQTNGGRVLAVTSIAPNLAQARATGYENVKHITFAGSQTRSDIGKDI